MTWEAFVKSDIQGKLSIKKHEKRFWKISLSESEKVYPIEYKSA